MTLKIETVQTYKTSDGRKFTEEAEALRHEAYLKHKEVVDAYVTSANLERTYAGFARSLIPGFIEYQASLAGVAKGPGPADTAGAQVGAQA